jgi:HK97 gp10 family phage protein
MADGVEFTMTGLEDLQAKLKEISKDMQTKGGRFALRKAAQVVRDKAIQNAAGVDDAKTKEDISKNIVERWNGRLNKQTGDLGFRIGVLGGAKAPAIASGEVAGKGKGNPGGDTFYWRFLEFGTKDIAARPFIRPAMDASKGEAADTFVREYTKAVERAIRRAKKTGK